MHAAIRSWRSAVLPRRQKPVRSHKPVYRLHTGENSGHDYRPVGWGQLCTAGKGSARTTVTLDLTLLNCTDRLCATMKECCKPVMSWHHMTVQDGAAVLHGRRCRMLQTDRAASTLLDLLGQQQAGCLTAPSVLLFLLSGKHGTQTGVLAISL